MEGTAGFGIGWKVRVGKAIEALTSPGDLSPFISLALLLSLECTVSSDLFGT